MYVELRAYPMKQSFILAIFRLAVSGRTAVAGSAPNPFENPDALKT
jgi:hypothetical protein